MTYKVSTQQITETVAPAAEPVTLEEAKVFLTANDFTDDDVLIASLVEAARDHVEQTTQSALVQRTYRADVPCFARAYKLPWSPLASIASIKYWNTDSPSVLTTLDTSTYLTNASGGVVYLASDVTVPSVDMRHDAVQITFVAGYAPDSNSPIDHAANVPDALKAAIKLIAGDLYINREAQSMVAYNENRTVKSLLQSYRNY